MKLLAQQIQEMIDVEDNQIVAYGYTFERESVEIYFENGQLVRSEDGDKKYCDQFNPEFFTLNIKRWYLGTEEKGFNRKLLNLLETFGCPINTTEGGHY